MSDLRAPAPSPPVPALGRSADAPPRPRVLVVGPRADAHGGIGSVQCVLEQHASVLADLDVVATHRDGPAAVRLWAMATGTARAAYRLVARRPAVAHMHVSQRTSVLRKGVLATLARTRGVPVVLHLHGSEFLDWFDALPRPARAAVRALLRPHRLVVLSETLRVPYRARLGVPDERVVALPNPVEWPAALPPVAAAPEERVLAVFLGRLGARKGIYDLVEACARLAPRQRRRLRLVAAGDGEVEEVRAAVAEAGVGDVVEPAGWLDRPERDALLRRAQVLVLPSTHEGLPMAVLEAMACGVVPVVTPVGALPEVVQDGVNGAVVPVGDPAALARTLEDLVADDEARRTLARRARADAQAYSAPRWAARLAAVWADAVRIDADRIDADRRPPGRGRPAVRRGGARRSTAPRRRGGP
ncbi:glycosyltransferase family 4 protein [Actinomycetospora sp. TBRC 11914]|uniref:glycosyltransferase family 4 protein n=1 Tax=Actinomycetospora sp. TBRC 11914 TaxID=2729387 RepID=UPI00145E309A|nr:glycosyltransferase family 4 protein [Actinomycetospora sp. TBRC 11914]NMO89053.1 glycosyltransferase family 4 protein [Actinomycetospora sp. TBRC 11914]